MNDEEVMQGEVSSLEEPTEDPELVPEAERVSQGVRMTPPLEGIETLEEYIPNEPVPDGVEVVGFDFIEAFLSLTEDLHKHPMTTNVERHIERAVPEVAIRIIEDGLGGELPPDVKSLYRLLSGLSFRWYASDEAQTYLGGAFEIVEFMRTFGLWVGELWPESEPSPDAPNEVWRDYEARWRLRGFDMPPRHAHDRVTPLWAMLAFDEDDLSIYQMFAYHPERDEYLEMDLSLIDYIYCVLGSCGAPGWQLLFTDYDFEENPWQMPPPHEWITRLEQFFPTFDAAYFSGRLGVQEEE